MTSSIFLSDIQINDRWLSELVAQGYSQLLEKSDEVTIEETGNANDSFDTINNLDENRTNTDSAIPPEQCSCNNDQERKDICVSNTQQGHSGKTWIHSFDREIEHPFQTSSLQINDPSAGIADNDILSIAPSEGERPVNQIQSEVLCFPKEFPMGNNTFLTRTESGEFKDCLFS